MKRTWLVTLLLAALMLLLCGSALAEDPIVSTMTVNPENLSAPGPVTVTVNISNSGDTDMQDAIVLYDPVGVPVKDFGENSMLMLKAGESKTWTGTWDVNQRTLDSGMLLFYIKYATYTENGQRQEQSQALRAKLEKAEGGSEGGGAGISVERIISPQTARNGQSISVIYRIANTGSVSLQNITVKENSDISTKDGVVAELKPGDAPVEIKFPLAMGRRDLVSNATITYIAAGSTEKQTEEVASATIKYGEPVMNATLTASAKGVRINDKATLTLELKNLGNVAYSNLRVTDPTLGDVFTNQELTKDGTLKLEKEVTLVQSTDYRFQITAVDDTGTEVSMDTESVRIEAIDPDKALNLSIVVTPDKSEVYEQPGLVRFFVEITNDSDVDAENVNIVHGAIRIYTFTSIPAGATRTLTRDAALSMEGKYMFTATTVDKLGIDHTFYSNEVRIAFSIPTPSPATPTPPAAPTPEPVFIPVTPPPIMDPSFSPVPKLVQRILLPLLILSGVTFIAFGVLLLIATKRRAEQRKASEAAYDHLERAKRRDYKAPASEPKPERMEKQRQGKEALQAEYDSEPDDDKDAWDWHRDDDDVLEEPEELELPHVKYLRNAYEQPKEEKVRSGLSGMLNEQDLYDDSSYGYEDEQQAENTHTDYADGYANEEAYAAGEENPHEESTYDEYYDGDGYEQNVSENVESEEHFSDEYNETWNASEYNIPNPVPVDGRKPWEV